MAIFFEEVIKPEVSSKESNQLGKGKSTRIMAQLMGEPKWLLEPLNTL